MTLLLASLIAPSLVLFLYEIIGRPYVHDEGIELENPHHILAPLGEFIAKNFGTPCLVCVNVWACLAVALVFCIFGSLEAYEVPFVIPVGYMVLRAFNKVGLH